MQQARVHALFGSLTMHTVNTAMQLELFANDRGFWVLKVDLDGIESEHGFLPYIKLLLSQHDAVRAMRLVPVVEHWNISPGDGNVYFARAIPALPRVARGSCA